MEFVGNFLGPEDKSCGWEYRWNFCMAPTRILLLVAAGIVALLLLCIIICICRYVQSFSKRVLCVTNADPNLIETQIQSNGIRWWIPYRSYYLDVVAAVAARNLRATRSWPKNLRTKLTLLSLVADTLR
jgi:hypothetical protein